MSLIDTKATYGVREMYKPLLSGSMTFAATLVLFCSSAAGQQASSPELEIMKSLEGRWEGSTTPGDPEAVVTSMVTSRGTTVVETLFPGTRREMMTVYHDDENGDLVMTHYCNAGNQPFLSLVESSDDRLQFELSPNDRTIDVEKEWHAHGLTLTISEDGTLAHDWRYWNDGQRQGGRNIQLVKVE